MCSRAWLGYAVGCTKNFGGLSCAEEKSPRFLVASSGTLTRRSIYLRSMTLKVHHVGRR